MQLTIGIPTFNEDRHLFSTLNSIRDELIKHDNSVELILIDNGSSDKTLEIANNYMKHFNQIGNVQFQIIENEKNKGFNFSIDTLIKEAQGKYLWVLGAHDKLLPNSLDIILKKINEEPIMIIFDGTVFDDKRNKEVNNSLYGNLSSRVFKNAEDFFVAIGGPSPLISLNITKTSAIRSIVDNELVTHIWPLFERMCDVSILRDQGEIVFIGTPLVQMLIKSDSWAVTGINNFGTTPFKSNYPGYFNSLESIEMSNIKFKNNKKIRYSIGNYRDVFGIPTCIAYAKYHKLKISPRLFLRTIKAYKTSKMFWLIGFPLLLVPSYVINTRVLEFMRQHVHLLRKLANYKPR